MTPAQFKSWRKHMRLSQQGAADALGISLSSVQHYETGQRRDSGERVDVPLKVRLACYALSVGVTEYDGPG